MLYMSYGSVCGIETQIFLAEGSNVIEGDGLAVINTDIAGIEQTLKALIQPIYNKPLTPRPLESLVASGAAIGG